MITPGSKNRPGKNKEGDQDADKGKRSGQWAIKEGISP